MGRQIAHDTRSMRREVRDTRRAWKLIRSGEPLDGKRAELDAMKDAEEAREEAGYWKWIESELRREKPPMRTFTRLGLMHSYTSCYAGALLTICR